MLSVVSRCLTFSWPRVGLCPIHGLVTVCVLSCCRSCLGVCPICGLVSVFVLFMVLSRCLSYSWSCLGVCPIHGLVSVFVLFMVLSRCLSYSWSCLGVCPIHGLVSVFVLFMVLSRCFVLLLYGSMFCLIIGLEARKGRTAQTQMEQKAKLDSASSQYDAIQVNPKGNCTSDGSRGSAAILNVCTCNVRTLRKEDDLDRLIDEVEQIKWDITGLCETQRKGERLSATGG